MRDLSELSLLVCKLLEQTATPLVLDADGLYAIKDRKELLCRRYEKGLTTILTPHEGEFAYLGGDLSEGRKMAALRFAQKYGCILVLTAATADWPKAEAATCWAAWYCPSSAREWNL